MNLPTTNPTNDDIARIAQAIWESEGRPDGRDHEHWMRARYLLEEGRAEAEFPDAMAASGTAAHPSVRPVQPGFQDAAPGMVPDMKDDATAELREEPAGRFSKQIAESPETAPADFDTPGPRNPAPIPPTDGEDYVAIPSADAAAAGAFSDNRHRRQRKDSRTAAIEPRLLVCPASTGC